VAKGKTIAPVVVQKLAYQPISPYQYVQIAISTQSDVLTLRLSVGETASKSLKH